MTSTLQDVITWCLVAAVVIIAAAALIAKRRDRRALTAQQRVAAELRNELAQRGAQLTHAQDRLHEMESDHSRTIQEAADTAEESTKSVLKAAARTLQGLAAEQQVILDAIQRKYGGHPVLSDLLEVNHSNAQVARRAQGIAVMCGGFLGRRREPATVYDVVRSAQGQIRNFNRVEITQQSAFAVKAPAVSAISLVVAEILDNAASSSKSDTPIEVTFQRTPNALCIVIDDAGVGMSDEQRQRATEMLSGEYRPSMSQLGNPPKFGFPVIALLARQYGFRVDVTGTSRYGGVRAVVLLPQELWTEETAPPAPRPQVTDVGGAAAAPGPGSDNGRTANGLPRRGTRPAPTTAESAPAAPRPVLAPEPAAERTAHGLPKRAARQAPAETPREAPAPSAPLPPAREAGRPHGRGLGAFQRAAQAGRESVSAPGEDSEPAVGRTAAPAPQEGSDGE